MLNRSPRLRFHTATPGEPTGGAAAVSPVAPAAPAAVPAAPAAPAAPATGEQTFPANTPWRDMTGPEQTAYWRHYSQVHEADAAAKQRLLDAAATANLTDSEQRDALIRAEGASAGAQPFIQDAVEGQLLALTGRTAEDIAGALEFVDVNRFITDGKLDKARVAAYATSLGAAPAVTPTAPPTPAPFGAAAAAMAPRAGAPVVGTSVADARAALVAKHLAANAAK